jgi:hypothetical protein
MSEENIKSFFTTSYSEGAGNESFGRLHEFLYVTIPLLLTTGVNKLSRSDASEISEADFMEEYTGPIEALMMFMLYNRLFDHKGEVLNHGDEEDQEEDVSSISDNNTVATLSTRSSQKTRGRPKNKKSFCPAEHDEHLFNTHERRMEDSLWYGWYRKAVQKINERNKKYFDSVRICSVITVQGSNPGGENENNRRNAPQSSLSAARQENLKKGYVGI